MKKEMKKINNDNQQQALIDKINAEEKAEYKRLLEKTNRDFIDMLANLNI